MGMTRRTIIVPWTDPAYMEPEFPVIYLTVPVLCHISGIPGLANLYNSHIFIVHLKIPVKFNAQTAKPGDILLHYAGNIGDGVGDHALLYLGAIRLDGSPNLSYVTIDCTTKNGAGNVYVGNKGDRYISQCYVVKPD